MKVFNVQRFSIHDGPGIRTTVFTCGCNLACEWCHNPESIPNEPVVLFYRNKCTNCGSCIKDMSACPNEALSVVGRDYSTEELHSLLLRDSAYYAQSGGGVTFSGGEPLLWHDELQQLLPMLGDSGIHRAVETSGCIGSDILQKLTPHVDLFIYDLKSPDPTAHKQATGADNSLILRNLDMLYQAKAHIIIRIPLIPNFNDSPESLSKFSDILLNYPDIEYVELMPFHPMAASKYDALQLPYKYADTPSYDREQLQKARQYLASRGINVKDVK